MNRMREWLFPAGSRRSMARNIVKKAVRHPEVIRNYLTPYKIKRACYYLLHGGIREFNRVFQARMIMGTDLKLEIQVKPLRESSNISDYPPLVFPKVTEARVSIIIPVYNQFACTYGCLESVLAHSGEVDYEVILADDSSTDLTREILSVVSNIQVVRGERQLYFLRNCNQAARKARGEYLLFLNNDIQVQPGWLKALVDLLDRRPMAGMAGSCLVYPDGRLQEAGGIVWQDGRAWNFGNGQNPALPQFRYVKEVDYISGASIIIRRNLWEKIGGFDERFAPAYCEDSDLSFAVRQQGYQVLYQPASVVVHFEGASHGTDVSSGLKAYQVENQKRLAEKWKAVLETEQPEHGQDVFLARDRSGKKAKILVADYHVPWYDKDAGARTVKMYLELFLELGMSVTFLPQDFYPHQPYTKELEQMGIEVLYGRDFVSRWREWLEENGRYFDYVLLNRPLAASQFMDAVKKCCQGKIFYYGHDLHYLREQRQYEISGDKALLKSARRWKRIEFGVMEKSDVVYAVGTFEEQLLRKQFPDKQIRRIPPYIYERILEGKEPSLAGRKNLLFVGGFGHTPNTDAVLWFGREIFPEIRRQNPEILWYVAGANPPEEVKALDGNGICILGHVTEKRLLELYETCRLAVIPLRFGAGVKGKVVECMYRGCPMITTPIGAEGLPMEDSRFAVAEAGENLAGDITALYWDEKRLKETVQAGWDLINRHFTREQAVNALLQDMDCFKRQGGDGRCRRK